MAGEKSTFIGYTDWLFIFEELSDEEAGKLIKHLLKYVNDEHPTTENVVVKVAFASIKTTLKRDLRKWVEIREKRVIAGRKGGFKQKKQVLNKTSKRKQSEANEAVIVPVTVKHKKEIYKENEQLGEKGKKKFGDFVLLTDSEYLKLKDKFQDVDNRIEKLDLYIGSRGKKYKSHYHTILSWSKSEDVVEKSEAFYEREMISLDYVGFRKKYGHDLAMANSHFLT